MVEKQFKIIQKFYKNKNRRRNMKNLETIVSGS